ncbi:Dipeptidyl peptidase family member 2 [Trichostrongylus colubriformis]|uniref:Dipeptidyl peptidase family member 2 n=1 Tax=Trichostrongylus colubriformis TaxID=6319 RepID=A0AAN8FJ19_TRICO
MDKPNTSDGTRQSRKFVRLLIAAFFSVTIILVVVSIALLLTQEPVNLSEDESHRAIPSNRDGNRSATRLSFRHQRPEYRKFTFDDLFSGKVFLKDTYTTAWTRDGGLIRTKDEYSETPSVATIIKPGTFNAVPYLSDSSIMNTMSSNSKYAYTSETLKTIFRYSNEALYRIFRIENGTRIGEPLPVGPTKDGTETVLVFKWNPNPVKNDFVFVHDYNIYYQADPEKLGSARQLTKDGHYLLRYGVSDWLYEEEILSSAEALWWSDSGNYISYLRLDDRSVNRVYIPKYLRNSQYPRYMEVPYPKAGVEENPQTVQYIWSLKTGEAVVAEPPAQLAAMNQSYYVFSNQWIRMPKDLRSDLGEERLVTVWANREQTLVYITLCNELDCALVYTQLFTINGRSMSAEPTDFKTILATEKGFFVILPHAYTDGNIYNHIAHVRIQKNGTGRITAWHGGAYDVKEMKGYEIKTDTLTFTSSGQGVGTMRLYRLARATSDNQSSIVVLSALVSDCDYGSYDVSPDGKRAVLGCLQPFKNTKLYLMNVDMPTNNKLLDGAEEAHIPFDLPELSYESVKLPSGFEVHIGLMKPPKFNPTLKYALLVDVYGGPNSCRVRRSTPNPNMIHFCSDLGVIVAWIDGRGSSNRGWNMRGAVYKALGQFEAIDTIDAVKYLTSRYSYIDSERVAVFGWSYGGFLSTHIAIRDQGKTFQCAIAVAPVVDFMLYDSAYTERYMGIPLENPGAYNASQLLNKAGRLKGVKYFLAHGEADDNVHFQNSALLAEALQGELVHFTQVVYPNQDHSIGPRQAHLFMEIGRFLDKDCFNNDD